jgi:Pentapeptide repeats (9 copies)
MYGLPHSTSGPSAGAAIVELEITRRGRVSTSSLPAGSGGPGLTIYDSVSHDGQQIAPGTCRFVKFVNCAFKASKFEGIAFHHCRFEGCYFRKAEFTGTDFIDCTFIDCHFPDSVFIRCKLDYSEFFNCDLEFDQVASTLPYEFNTRRDVVRSLKANCNARGMIDDARRFLLEELRASRDYNRNKAFNLKDPYYRKYQLIDRLSAATEWVSSVSLTLCGVTGNVRSAWFGSVRS